MIDRNDFARECGEYAKLEGVDDHYLLAVAQLRSGISDDDIGEHVGPYRITPASWQRISSRLGSRFEPNDINRPARQIRLFAAYTSLVSRDLEGRLQRSPKAWEIYEEQAKEIGWLGMSVREGERAPDIEYRLAEAFSTTAPLRYGLRDFYDRALKDTSHKIEIAVHAERIGDYTIAACNGGTREAPPPSGNTVEFLFATDRERAGSGEPERFSNERAPTLTFGAARVNVPNDKHHKIGQLELPSEYKLFGVTLYREDADPARHFIVKSVDALDQDTFVQIARSNTTRRALVFVHGFNTTFNEGVLRFAQIVWDLQFNGTPVLYSWPSRGGLQNYLYDKESTLTSRARFIELLRLLQTRAAIETVHILAHSMGNMVVLDALHQASQQFVATPLGEVILAAPDVPQRAFGDWIASLGKIARGVTLYASSQDRALLASRKANADPRAGDVMSDGPIVLPGIDSIDVSAIGAEMFGLNHNVFASNRSLIDDIGRIILTGQRPVHERSPQIRGMPSGAVPPRFWRYPA